MPAYLLLIGMLAVAIVPTKGRDEVRLVTKVRAGEGPPAVVARTDPADAKLFGGRKRVAALPFVVPAEDPSLASQRTGFMEAILADLRYVPSLLALDRSEILAALARRPKETSIGVGHEASELAGLAELGVNLKVSHLITGTVATDGPVLRLELNLVEVEGGRAKLVATSKASGTRSDIFTLGDSALLALLEQVGFTPPADLVGEIQKVPTRNFEARSQADAGFARLDQISARVLSKEEVDDLAAQALKHANAAIKADRKYMQAYLLKTSSLFVLGRLEDGQMSDCQVEARKRNDPDRVDALTGLEIEGDYLTFRDKDLAEASSSYEKILGYDPGNLHALWTLTGLYAGDFFEFKRTPEAGARANRYAGRLILAHPGSDAARAFDPAPAQARP